MLFETYRIIRMYKEKNLCFSEDTIQQFLILKAVSIFKNENWFTPGQPV
jgi:hypothetical protein